VQIYRLVTRGTYEREMFEKAGMKLGLDRAVLSRMESSDQLADASGLTTGTLSSLSKVEIERLLKKGAYAAILENENVDEDEQSKFQEEDIDQILERRAVVIRHGEETNGKPREASLFSKATFSLNEDKNNAIELDDPSFWDKYVLWIWTQNAH
jgi:hypothetical protein